MNYSIDSGLNNVSIRSTLGVLIFANFDKTDSRKLVPAKISTPKVIVFEYDFTIFYCIFINGKTLSGRRRCFLSLGNVLRFVTGTEEEPLLGFQMQPSINFVEAKNKYDFAPTASTCSNTLNLPRPSVQLELPEEETELFQLYDYAFTSEFFGVM